MIQQFKITGFDWDKGNLNKNEDKHAVTALECEQIFYNEPLIISESEGRSLVEQRFSALGRTFQSRWLQIAFTIREGNIRVISARPMSKKERKVYEEEIEKNS